MLSSLLLASNFVFKECSAFIRGKKARFNSSKLEDTIKKAIDINGFLTDNLSSDGVDSGCKVLIVRGSLGRVNETSASSAPRRPGLPE